jgi:hypothetical protein
MDIIFEFIVSFLTELGGPLIFELLAELGLRSAASALGKDKEIHPIFSLFGYIFLALICSSISIAIHRGHYIKNVNLQYLNLVISPVLIGLIMKYRGKYLHAKDKKTIRLDSFWYGYVFALTFSLVRFIYGN